MRRIILTSLSLIYLSTFISWGLQIEGLYGDFGILPVGSFLHQYKGSVDANSNYKPLLLKYYTSLFVNYEVFWFDFRRKLNLENESISFISNSSLVEL
jgi:hypothetical protein